MSQYLAFFRIKFISSLQYRAAAIAGILTQFFFGFVFVMVYYAFYESNSTGPIEFQNLVSYIWLQQAFFSLTFVFYRDKEIIKMIKDGNIAYELCRPGSIYFKWYTRIFTAKLASVSLKFLPVIVIGFFLPKPFNLCLPNSFWSFIAFLITLILSSFLITALISLLHLLMFYTIDGDGILILFRIIAELFSGGIVPIVFLPNFLQTISKFLPFQYVGDVPFRLYTGTIPSSNLLFIILIQVFWIVVVIFIGLLLEKKIAKILVVQGG